MPRAIKLFRESIAIDGGKRYEAYFFLGKVLNGEKRFTEAADALRAASKLVPDNQAVLQELASATARMSIPVDAHGKAVAELPDDEQLAAALAKNLQEHHKESLASCETFYCAPESASSDEATGDAYQPPPMAGYPMGPVPSNDFPAAFENRSDEQNTQIYVSEVPIFSLEECEKVISLAESDGKLQAATSGKYTIGRAWIKEMPTVLAWFNEALKTKLYPTLRHLFGELVSHPGQLRAHTVLIAKYNASDTTGRSDVHVDDALLALTIALSPPESYEGGGTYFEHLNKSIDMGQGHVTFRPGSVRHAGAPISAGVRYVIGGFIALDDRVEHVRRLVERGNRLLMLEEAGQAGPEHLQYAAQLFQWGLQLNPNCTLCHQSLADVLLRLGQPLQAEAALRKQIALLPFEADGHFSLGVALRKQGRLKEARDAYERAVRLAPDDAQGHVNLGAVLGELGEPTREVAAYRAALQLQPSQPVVWMNLAGVLAAHVKAPTAALAAYRRAASAYAAEEGGALADVAQHFAAAAKSLTRPADAPVAAALVRIAAGARQLVGASEALHDAPSGVCGTPCDEIGAAEPTGNGDEGADAQQRGCVQSWLERCGSEAGVPGGIDAKSATVADVCQRACAADALERRAASKIEQSKVSR